jgi:hypothetical protein
MVLAPRNAIGRVGSFVHRPRQEPTATRVGSGRIFVPMSMRAIDLRSRAKLIAIKHGAYAAR